MPNLKTSIRSIEVVKKCSNCYWCQEKEYAVKPKDEDVKVERYIGCYVGNKWSKWISKKKIDVPNNCPDWKREEEGGMITYMEGSRKDDRSSLAVWYAFSYWLGYPKEMEYIDPLPIRKDIPEDPINELLKLWLGQQRKRVRDEIKAKD